MEHKITIMKYQTMFPGMTKKLFDEKERFYQIAVISIRLDELQTKDSRQKARYYRKWENQQRAALE